MACVILPPKNMQYYRLHVYGNIDVGDHVSCARASFMMVSECQLASYHT